MIWEIIVVLIIGWVRATVFAWLLLFLSLYLFKCVVIVVAVDGDGRCWRYSVIKCYRNLLLLLWLLLSWLLLLLLVLVSVSVSVFVESSLFCLHHRVDRVASGGGRAAFSCRTYFLKPLSSAWTRSMFAFAPTSTLSSIGSRGGSALLASVCTRHHDGMSSMIQRYWSLSLWVRFYPFGRHRDYRWLLSSINTI